jgi:hypothetical protein
MLTLTFKKSNKLIFKKKMNKFINQKNIEKTLIILN